MQQRCDDAYTDNSKSFCHLAVLACHAICRGGTSPRTVSHAPASPSSCSLTVAHS